MKRFIQLVAILALAVGGAALAGCQSNDHPSDQPPSSVGNGQTRNNGPFAPDANPRNSATTNPSY